METMSFAFGALSMIGLLLIVTIVVGVVKVIKLEKQIKSLEKSLNDMTSDIWQNLHELSRNAHDRIDKVEEYIPQAINDQITDSVTQCNSYTDKRIDKLIDTYFMVKESREILKEQKNKNN